MASNMLVSVLLPVVFSPLIYLIGKKRKRAAGILSFILLTISGLFLSAEIPSILGGKTSLESYQWIRSLDIEFGLLADGLSLPIGLVIVFLSALCALVSVAYLEKRRGHGAYYFFLLLFASGMLGVVLATNLLQFYFFWELMIIPSYFLIVGWGYGDAQKVGLKYFLWTRIGGLCLLFGILWLYSLTGTFSISQIKEVVAGQDLTWIFLLFMIAFFVKMAIFPLHNWLPDAHSEAPAPISAMLSGVMIKTGAYGVVRLAMGMLSLPASHAFWLSGLAAFTMLYGAMMALIQKDVKRLLAFSSISQMGLILFGLMSTDMGIRGALFHVINHAVAKGLLFIGAGALLYRLGTRDMDQMGGLVSKMPVTAISMALAALAISTTPPLSCFVSEVIIIGGGIQAGYNWQAGIILIASVLTAGYFLWMLYKIFFGDVPKKFAHVREAPLYFTIPLISLSIPIVVFGIWPELVLGLLG